MDRKVEREKRQKGKHFERGVDKFSLSVLSKLQPSAGLQLHCQRINSAHIEPTLLNNSIANHPKSYSIFFLDSSYFTEHIRCFNNLMQCKIVLQLCSFERVPLNGCDDNTQNWLLQLPRVPDLIISRLKRD
ncbi:hypothetical protein QQG55_25140 [Brugia pahangi]